MLSTIVGSEQLMQRVKQLEEEVIILKELYGVLAIKVCNFDCSRYVLYIIIIDG